MFVNVQRGVIWADACRQMTRKRFSPRNTISVKFADSEENIEGVVDIGGPKREFLRMAVKAANLDLGIFVGPEICRSLFRNSVGTYLISHCLHSIYTFLYMISNLAKPSGLILTWLRGSELIPNSWERLVPPCWYTACFVCGAWRAWWEFFQSQTIRFNCLWYRSQLLLGRCPGFSLEAKITQVSFVSHLLRN